jgi:hypothetical protein
MKPAAIIHQAAADGVSLTLISSGNIKLSGSRAAVNQWIPVIRDNKAELIEALPPAPMTPAEEAAVRAWLAQMGETDLAEIAEVMQKCQSNAAARAYCLAHAVCLVEWLPWLRAVRQCNS